MISVSDVESVPLVAAVEPVYGPVALGSPVSGVLVNVYG